MGLRLRVVLLGIMYVTCCFFIDVCELLDF
jgi:hypothetical protein